MIYKALQIGKLTRRDDIPRHTDAGGQLSLQANETIPGGPRARGDNENLPQPGSRVTLDHPHLHHETTTHQWPKGAQQGSNHHRTTHPSVMNRITPNPTNLWQVPPRSQAYPATEKASPWIPMEASCPNLQQFSFRHTGKHQTFPPICYIRPNF